MMTLYDDSGAVSYGRQQPCCFLLKPLFY